MNYRERFSATLNHAPVDRVPFDLGGTSLSSANEHVQTRLREALGVEGASPGVYTKFDERILTHLDIDIRRVGTVIQPASDLTRRVSDTETVDCWGIRRRYTGLYADIVGPPLQGASIDDLERYPWPKPENIDKALIERSRIEAKRLSEETPYVVCGEHPVYGVLELGCWMCGYDDFLLKMAIDEPFVRRFFDIILAYQKRVIEIYYGAVGRYIHFTTSGDDFGTQQGPLISPDMFESLIKPYFAERIRYTKQFTDAAYFHHSCGSIFPIIPHLIDAGVDILNPIQPGVRDMEPAKLKTAYGEKLVFHGGIDTQHLIRNGTPESVSRGVVDVLGAMRDSGYMLAPAHNIQDDVPAENIIAMFTAAQCRCAAGKTA